jgi:hypothetical protein
MKHPSERRPHHYWSGVIVKFPDGRVVKYKSVAAAASGIGVHETTIRVAVYNGWKAKGATVKPIYGSAPRGVPVLCNYPDGRVERYETVLDAQRASGVNRTTIFNRIYGRISGDAYGIIFERAK